MKRTGLLVACTLALPLITLGVRAEEPIVLRLATFTPSTHIGVKYGDNILMADATERSQGRVKFEFYPAEQLGKANQLLDLVKVGVIDIAEVPTGVASDKLPLLGVLDLPGKIQSSCEGASIMRSMGKPGGFIYENEYAPNGIRVLSYHVYPPYVPSASRRPITRVEDLHGLKYRNAGGAMAMSIATLGGVPVKMASPEVMQSLARGTLDSMMSSYLSVVDYDLYEAAKYGVTGYSLGTPGVFAVMSERKFQSLPADIQQVLVEAGIKSEQSFCNHAEQAEKAAMAQVQEAGMTIYSWTDEQKATLDKLLVNVPLDWAHSLDRKGRPGSEVLNAFERELLARRSTALQ
ncbi:MULTISPECIES: TRAP transporter substrate-binding protein DctP [Pseudomonas]|uniref:TRAP transporter substrate-binding protein DctP n=1 Tax=Pseudomonas TaxID=286 RepID=UPI00380640BF